MRRRKQGRSYLRSHSGVPPSLGAKPVNYSRVELRSQTLSQQFELSPFLSRSVRIDSQAYYFSCTLGRVRMPPKPRLETPIERLLWSDGSC